MKANHLAFDDVVADSMAQAASLLHVPLEAVKMAKRNGSSAFRGSRVHLGKLKDDLEFRAKEPGVSDVLLIIAHDVAQRVSGVLARCPEKRFRAEYDRLCQAIQLGLGATVCVVEPDSADEFLAESAALFESIFENATRKKLRRVNQPEKE